MTPNHTKRLLGLGGVLSSMAIAECSAFMQLRSTDYDGDRKADLAVYHRESGTWYVQSSGGGPSMTANWGWSGAIPVPGDYDGDAKTDLAVVDTKTWTWYIRRSSDKQRIVRQFGASGCVAVQADYDRDNRTDLAVYHPPTGTWGILESSTGRQRLFNWGWPAASPVPADYDGDGRTDYAVYDAATGNWHIRESRSGNGRVVNWGWSEAVPAPADFDGDGKVDFAVYHRANGTWYIRYSRSGTSITSNWGNNEAIPVPADYDGDLLADIAVHVPAGGAWFIWQSRARSSRVAQWGWSASLPVMNPWWISYNGANPGMTPPVTNPGGPTNSPPPSGIPADELNIAGTISLGNHSNIKPQNATVTKRLFSADCEGSSGLRLNYETLGWPSTSPIGDNIDSRIFIFWVEGSTVYGAHFEWKRPGQTSKSLSNVVNGYLPRRPPKGATVWFCLVSNDASQRTNVVRSKTPFPM